MHPSRSRGAGKAGSIEQPPGAGDSRTSDAERLQDLRFLGQRGRIRTIRRSAGSFPVRFGIRALSSVWAEVIFVVGMTGTQKRSGLQSAAAHSLGITQGRIKYGPRTVSSRRGSDVAIGVHQQHRGEKAMKNEKPAEFGGATCETATPATRPENRSPAGRATLREEHDRRRVQGFATTIVLEVIALPLSSPGCKPDVPAATRGVSGASAINAEIPGFRSRTDCAARTA